MSDQQLDTKKMRSFILNGLKAWHKPDHSVPMLGELLIIDAAKHELGLKDGPRSDIIALKHVISTYLTDLGEQSPDRAALITQQYLELLLVKEIAHNEKLTLEQVKHKIRRGIDHMAQLAQTEEVALRRTAVNRLLSCVPAASYQTLVGVEDVCDQIVERLTGRAPSTAMTGLVGIGGIGKTSMMRESVLRAVETRTFENLLWLDVRDATFSLQMGPQQPLSELTLLNGILAVLDGAFPLSAESVTKKNHLRELLLQTRTLLVMDNIETPQQLDILLTTIEPFSQALTVIFSSRIQPNYRPNLSTFPIRELNQNAAIDLIRQHAQQIGILDLDEPEILNTIFDKVGGNPLAIKLIVGLAEKLDLPLILQDLVSAQHRRIEEMYLKIFEKSWQSLTEAARQLLMVMPLATERGMTFEIMQRTSGLDFGQLGEAIAELNLRSLIDINGTPLSKTYTIHQLTRAFLGSHIIQWEGLLPGLTPE